MKTATCRTPGCPSNGHPVDIDSYEDPETGETRYPDVVVCGACGRQITDLTTDPGTEEEP